MYISDGHQTGVERGRGGRLLVPNAGAGIDYSAYPLVAAPVCLGVYPYPYVYLVPTPIRAPVRRTPNS